jgi:hypothetical protein
MTDLTCNVIGSAFAALPISCVRLHDENIEPDWYVSAPMRDKRERVKANLAVFAEWARREGRR